MWQVWCCKVFQGKGSGYIRSELWPCEHCSFMGERTKIQRGRGEIVNSRLHFTLNSFIYLTMTIILFTNVLLSMCEIYDISHSEFVRDSANFLVRHPLFVMVQSYPWLSQGPSVRALSAAASAVARRSEKLTHSSSPSSAFSLSFSAKQPFLLNLSQEQPLVPRWPRCCCCCWLTWALFWRGILFPARTPYYSLPLLPPSLPPLCLRNERTAGEEEPKLACLNEQKDRKPGYCRRNGRRYSASSNT